MDEARIGEWILERLTTTDRSAAIVGDIVEQNLGLSRVRFWSCFAWTVLMLMWRPALSFAIACICGGFAVLTVLHSAQWHTTEHRLIQSFCTCFTAAFWIMAAYFVTKRGLFNQFARVAFLIGLAGMIGMCLQWRSRTAELLAVLAIGATISWCLTSRSYRKVLFCLFASLPFAAVGWTLMFFVVTVFPSTILLAFCAFVLSVIIPCTYAAKRYTTAMLVAVEHRFLEH